MRGREVSTNEAKGIQPATVPHTTEGLGQILLQTHAILSNLNPSLRNLGNQLLEESKVTDAAERQVKQNNLIETHTATFNVSGCNKTPMMWAWSYDTWER